MNYYDRRLRSIDAISCRSSSRCSTTATV